MKKAKKHIHYHKDGSIWAKGNMLDGKMDVYWEWFRKPARNATHSVAGGDGSKMRSGYFNKGKQVGEWTTYDKKGKEVKVTNYGEN